MAFRVRTLFGTLEKRAPGTRSDKMKKKPLLVGKNKSESRFLQDHSNKFAKCCYCKTRSGFLHLKIQ